MKDGFISVACASCDIKVSNIKYNKEQILSTIDELSDKKINLVLMPELCLTGATCADLFYSDALLCEAEKAVAEICEYTKGKYPVFVIGTPLIYNSDIYNCAVIIRDGSVLGVVAKTFFENRNANFQSRYFLSAANIGADAQIVVAGQNVPFGNNLIFSHDILKNYTFVVEIGDDLLTASAAGANIVLNMCSHPTTSITSYHDKMMVTSSSARFNCGYVFCNSCSAESTQDAVFCANNMIAECGDLILENCSFEPNVIITQIDVGRISFEVMARQQKNENDNSRIIIFKQECIDTHLTREYDKNPFLPKAVNSNALLEKTLQIQAYGLKRRIEHIGTQKVVIGISGGLDSTLALLVAMRSLKLLNRPATDIIAVSMPCFGTSARTKSNALLLCEYLGVDFKEIDISQSVKQHFIDIDHNINNLDTTYENSQARERTQVIMDIANKYNGIVVGTGDLSELALGWATYNGDHMSMYNVNASIPKTLVRQLVRYESQNYCEKISDILLDIIDTPVSPELLPADSKGNISQATEDIVGPYELHDFFLYHFVKNSFSPLKIYRIAKYAFDGSYDKETILKWLKIFIKRFFSQQFKRSCLPDGPKATEVSLSPRGSWLMPSDASYEIFIKQLNNIE